MPYLADCSLCLINRTGAYFVAREIVDGLPHHFPVVRQWRLIRRDTPAGLLRAICGRLMLKELSILGALSFAPWPVPRRARRYRTLFMDPLYVLRARLNERDVVLCHDIGPVSHPELFDADTSRLYRTAYDKIRAARPGMVFVSQTTRNAFVEFFGADFRTSEVIPLFVRDSTAEGVEEPVPGIEKPFFLTVGGFERRKNQARSIEAFRQSGLGKQGFSYVLCGPGRLDSQGSSDPIENDDSISLLSYVSLPNLRWLYRNAYAFVLPSLLEGFGMPALEAAQHGLLSIVSTDGALAEATGDLSIKVDPLSVSAISKAMCDAAALPEEDRLRKGQSLMTHAAAFTRARFLSLWDRYLMVQ